NMSAEQTASNLNNLYDANSTGLPNGVLAGIAGIGNETERGQALFKDLIGPVWVNLGNQVSIPQGIHLAQIGEVVNFDLLQQTVASNFGQAFYKSDYMQDQLAISGQIIQQD